MRIFHCIVTSEVSVSNDCQAPLLPLYIILCQNLAIMYPMGTEILSSPSLLETGSMDKE